MCVLTSVSFFSQDNISLLCLHKALHRYSNHFTQPLCCTRLDHCPLWLCACMCSIVCACTHAWIHACVRICARTVCLSARVCGHARMWMHLCMSVIVLHVSAHPDIQEFLCVGICVRVSVRVCFCVYSVSGLQGSAPYLALAAGGAQQVPNCCRPHNGFYKPGAGTGPWLSCRPGSPPLSPCRLHWRSSQSVRRKHSRVHV